MASNAICGNGGSVLVSTHEVSEISDWNLTIERSPTEVPLMDTSMNYLVCTPVKYSGTFSANWYMDDTVGQLALQSACEGGTTVTLHLSVDGTDEYTGAAYITQTAITAPYNGIVSVSFTFQGSGDWTSVPT